jgi:hypothetical protein
MTVRMPVEASPSSIGTEPLLNRRTNAPATTPRRRKRASRLRNGKDQQMQAFSEAAEGIRTLDLLHGKQTL